MIVPTCIEHEIVLEPIHHCSEVFDEHGILVLDHHEGSLCETYRDCTSRLRPLTIPFVEQLILLLCILAQVRLYLGEGRGIGAEDRCVLYDKPLPSVLVDQLT